MGRGRIAGTLQTAILLPLVLLAASPIDLTRFLCSMDGALRDRCCCPGDADAAAAEENAPALDAPSCCALDRVEVAAAAAEPARTTTPHLAPVVWLEVTPSFARGLPPQPPTPAPNAVVPEGPPLRVLKQAFLI
jgi:hypothetical protein